MTKGIRKFGVLEIERCTVECVINFLCLLKLEKCNLFDHEATPAICKASLRSPRILQNSVAANAFGWKNSNGDSFVAWRRTLAHLSGADRGELTLSKLVSPDHAARCSRDAAYYLLDGTSVICHEAQINARRGLGLFRSRRPNEIAAALIIVLKA